MSEEELNQERLDTDLINFQDVNTYGEGISQSSAQEALYRRSSRLRRPNVTHDDEALRRERVISLGRTKSGTLAALTTKRNEIERLMKDEANYERVEQQLVAFNELIAKYEGIHQRFILEITDEASIDNAIQACNQLRISTCVFQQRVQNWLSTTVLNKSKWMHDQKDGDSEIHPEDSISQVMSTKGSRLSKHGSYATQSSSKSSISLARVQETARIAELEAEAKALQDRKTLREKELRLKEEEIMLSFQKEELNLETEISKAKARENAYAQAEAETLPGASQFYVPGEASLKAPRQSQSKRKENLVKSTLGIKDGERSRNQTTSDKTEQILTGNQFETDRGRPQQRVSKTAVFRPEQDLSHGYRLLEHQGHILEELITHQQRATLPRRQMSTFGGEITEYRPFIRAFEALIEAKEPDDASKLYYLEQYTTGRAKELVRSCQYMDSREGYKKARSLLEEKYGQKYQIAMAHVDQLIQRQPIKSEDADGLEQFSVALTSCSNTLKAIDHLNKIENPDTMKKIVERLPYKLQERWRDVADNIMNIQRREVTIGDITKFVTDKARSLNNPVFGKLSVPSKDQTSKLAYQKRGQTTKLKSSFAVEVGTRQDKATETERYERRKNCVCCGCNHELSDCQSFVKKSYNDRLDIVKENYLCFSCLKKGHQARNCYRRKPCKECYGKHSTSLHVSEDKQRESGKSKGENEESPKGDQRLSGSNNNTQSIDGAVNSAYAGTSDCVTVLPVVPVRVRSSNSQDYIETYALLDNGSSSTFCTDSLRKKLQAKGIEQKIRLTTIGASEEVTTFLVGELEVADLDQNRSFVLRDVLCRPSIPVSRQQIPTQEDVDNWPHLEGKVFLPNISQESSVDLLIGSNAPDLLQPKEIIHSQDGGPYASKTEFGWVINGPIGRKPATIAQTSFFVRTETNPMCSVCTDFVDESHMTKGMSRDDLRFMEIVEHSITKTPDDHYEISLPLKDTAVKMPNNRAQALNRMRYLKNKFGKNPKFQSDYSNCVADVIQKGYARKVPTERLQRNDGRVWYLPHHGIYHVKKPGKIRVVFDCSADFQGTSLNEELYQGPDLTNTLLGVLLRFRQKKTAFMTDVEGMFHQVRVPESDQDLLRFLWWPNGDTEKEIEEYQMTVHLFGATSSPSCANYALRKTADDNSSSFSQEVIDTVKNNFYVDDCLKSVATDEEGIDCAKQLQDLMLRGGFNLTKWTSNSRAVLESIPKELRSSNVKDLDLCKNILPNERALGVQWFVSTDTLGYKIDVKTRPLTRRGIASVVSSVYDPLGFAIPFLLPAKVLLQDLCRQGLGWDDEIPTESKVKWQNWLQNVPDLANFFVPRCITPPEFGTVVKNEIHHFSDASLAAYGAVSFLRSINERNEVNCSLLIAKSRLAPLRAMTVPRLELAAATLAVQLERILRKELEIPIESSTFWTDSTTVILYLNNNSKRFHTYVANRIAYILSNSEPQQWRYVSSENNPADDASRGSSLVRFLQNERWRTGPQFLKETEENWPKLETLCTSPEIPVDDPEVKHEIVLFQTVEEQDPLMKIFCRFSSWLRLKRFVAKCLRWQLKFRNRNSSETEEQPQGNITVQEMKAAEESIIKYLQMQAFPNETDGLRKGNGIRKSSPLRKLDPTIVDGVLHVGGRLNRAPLNEEAKNPIILPKKNHVVDLIIRHYHNMLGHTGREHVLAALRQRYWIINANSMVRRILSSCFDCKRRQASTGKQKMADLPIERVNPNEPPFTRVGVDYFGPFLVRQKRSIVKRYGVVFTCLAVRAIHLEISNSLDTASFIMALRRFIARRGQVKEIISDNGTNLVAGCKELRDNIQAWNQNQIHEFLLQKETEWRFNPPTGSHHGGVWERVIRTIRKVLNALVKEQTLDEEALHTLMCEVEAIINSRPITKVSSDPNDMDPLTPNHLLLLRQKPSLPPGLFDKNDLYSRKRWRQIQYLSNLFWTRWTKEYLPLLQERQKWNNTQRNFKVGDIVLIVDQSMPRNLWPIGRIIQVFEDDKGLVRRVNVRTKSTILDRPITKLCLLETIEELEH